MELKLTNTIKNDEEFKKLVYLTARGNIDDADKVLFDVINYLWDISNWYRLKETIEGKFIREVQNDCPDLALRFEYRECILKNSYILR